MISRSRGSYPSDELKKRAEAVEGKDRKQSREPESGEVKSEYSGGLLGRSSSLK